MTRLRIEVDRELCELNGQCEFVAPELFSVNDDDLDYVENPPPELGDKAKQAVKVCPQLAIRLLAVE